LVTCKILGHPKIKPWITGGTGKSHWCEALGQHAIDHGMLVAWFSIEDLGALVRRHRADDSVAKAIRRIITAELVVVDDIGLLPVSPDAAEGFYRLVDAAYEKRSLAVSSNLHPADWYGLFPNPVVAEGVLDRLVNWAHHVLMQGKSYRPNKRPGTHQPPSTQGGATG